MRSTRLMVRGTNWFGVFWLVYLLQPITAFLDQVRPAWAYPVFAAAILGYVVMYFWVLGSRPSERSGGWRGRSLVGVLSSFVALAALWPFVGDSGTTFLVYAAAFAGFQPSPALAAGTVLANLATVAGLYAAGLTNLETLVFVGLLSLAITVSNGYFYRWTVASRRLREAQAEVARIAKVAERERIARDLHDLLGHTLSVIVLKSELASRLAELDPPRAAREIRDVERISREALAEVRSAVRGYRSSGLTAELANASLALEAAGVRLEHSAVPLALAPEVENALALALREAVTNVVRHAAARECRVALERAGETVHLTVTDDGRGGLFGEGSGLIGMRERVSALGGRVEFDGSKGTRLQVSLPLARAGARATPSGLALEPGR